jgi:hypothetical protein
VIEPPVVDDVTREARSFEGALLASITPAMVARIGTMTEELVELLDVVTSPEVVRLVERLGRLAPTIAALIDSVVGPEEAQADRGPLAQNLAAAGQAARKALQEARPLSYGELLNLPRRPAVARVLRAAIAFLEAIAEPVPDERSQTVRGASPEPSRGGGSRG